MKTKELHEKIVANMKAWQKVENDSIEMTNRISQQTDNPVVRIVMAVIAQDSKTHHRVQQLIADSLEKEGMIEQHIALERKTIDYAKSALAAIKGTKMLVQQYLLEYLLADEEKHNKLLDDLEAVKRGMYPYA
jgi:bacterioferritin (cytochrome b1)